MPQGPAHAEPPPVQGVPVVAPTLVPVPPVAAAPAPVDAHALVQAILADPALTQQLARELAKHLPEQVLLELAWEVLPDLAERIRP